MAHADPPKPGVMRPQWRAIVVYHSQNGPIEVDYVFKELYELHRLIELGPDWKAIERIVVTLDTTSVAHPDTIDVASDR